MGACLLAFLPLPTEAAPALRPPMTRLQTNDAAVAAAFHLPDTHFALDFVQPEQLTLRMLMRSLGGWGSRLGADCFREAATLRVAYAAAPIHHLHSRLHALLAAVMWDSIQPTDEWLQAQLPPLLRGPLSRLMAGEGGGAPHADYEALAQASGWGGADCGGGSVVPVGRLR